MQAGYAFPNLTAADRAVLRAVTGVTLDADGAAVETAPGHDPPDWGMFLQLDLDRERGGLTEELTQEYVQALIDRRSLDPAQSLFDQLRRELAGS